MSELHFIDRPSPNFDARRRSIDLIVLHYTGMQDAETALARLTDPAPVAGRYPGPWQGPDAPAASPLGRVSAHYVVGEDGAIYRLVAEEDRAWHAGVSAWKGEADVNARAVGIEIVNGGHDFGLPDFPDVQIDAVIALVKDIMVRRALAPDQVVGHSDIAPERKLDPGEKFPWKRLADAGASIWPQRVARQAKCDDPVGRAQAQLSAIGYALSRSDVMDNATRAALKAFQRRFRPEKVDGLIDEETEALRNQIEVIKLRRGAAGGAGAGVFMNRKHSKSDAEALRQWCLARLAENSAAMRDPMSASARALAVDLMQRRDKGEIDDAALMALVKHVADAALTARAGRLAASKPSGDWASVVNAALAQLAGAPLAEVKAALEPGRLGVVFTAHPTFALSRAMRAALGALAGGEKVDLGALAHHPDQAISLGYEHEDAAAALRRAQDGLAGFNGALFDWLEANVEGPWWTIAPAPVRLATWVGYDIDGRTDIHWAETIRLRLAEKAAQLSRYAGRLDQLGAAALAARLARAGKEAAAQAELFGGDLNDAEQIVAAANRLTAEGPDRLVSLGPALADLDALIAGETGARRKQLCVLR